MSKFILGRMTMKDPYILILNNVDNQSLRKYLIQKIEDGTIISKYKLNYGAIGKWRLGTEKIPEKYKSYILEFYRLELQRQKTILQKVEKILK